VTYTEEHVASFRVEDYLNDKRGIMAIQLLVEGCSIRTAQRVTNLHRDAIIKLLVIAGERCERLLDELISKFWSATSFATSFGVSFGKTKRTQPLRIVRLWAASIAG
jgi:hypothetical protein